MVAVVLVELQRNTSEIYNRIQNVSFMSEAESNLTGIASRTLMIFFQKLGHLTPNNTILL